MGRYKGGKLVFDNSHPVSYGYFRCPVCEAKFYSGGPALHESGCSKIPEGYEPCDYHFGTKEFVTAFALSADPSDMREEHRLFLGRLERELPDLYDLLKRGLLGGRVLWNQALRSPDGADRARTVIQMNRESLPDGLHPFSRLAMDAELERLLERKPHALVEERL